jgi:hypothetical protein
MNRGLVGVSLVAAGAFLVGVGTAGAACVGSSPSWTATPDRASVATCVGAASIGDTINISAGNAAWSSAVLIRKGLAIVGAGPGLTNITGPGFGVDLAMDNRLEISGISFQATSMSNGTGIEISNETVHPDQVRLYNLTFTNYEFGIWVGGAHGVVHNTTFTNNDHDFRIKGYRSGELANHTPPPPWLYDSLHQWVAEDCTFNWTRSGNSIRVDTEFPATYVIRYSTFNTNGIADTVDMHGSAGEANNQQGVRLYNNTLNFTTGLRFADIRGGVNHLIYNNTSNRSATIDFSANPGGSPVATNSFVWNNTPANSWHVNRFDGATYTAAAPANFTELPYPHPFRRGAAPPAAPSALTIR